MNNIMFQALNRVDSFLVLLIASFFIIFLFLVYLKRNRKDNISILLDTFYSKIKDEIKFAVSPKFIDLSIGVTELIELATEIWRMEQRLTKVAETLPENHRKGLENSMSKLKRYISNYDIEIIDYTNQKFNDGLNLDVLSVDKDPSVTTPIVKETVEPTIVMKGQVVKKAKIILLSN